MSFAEWSNKKKKKEDKENQQYNSFADWSNAKQGITEEEKESALAWRKDELAPVKEEEKEKERTWFNTSAFSNIDSVGDVFDAIIATKKSISENLVAGAMGIAESAIDTGAYFVGGVGGLFSDDFQDDVSKFIADDIINEKQAAKDFLKKPGIAQTVLGANPLDAVFGEDEEDSILGEKSKDLIKSGGQLGGQIGLQYVGVPWQVTTGVTSFGSGVEQTLNDGATYGEAGLQGVIQAGSDILTESLFKGSGLGEKGLIDLSSITSKISNKVVKTLFDFGIDLTAEGMEEVAAKFFTDLGSNLYKDESFSEVMWNENTLDEYLESYFGGMVLSGGSNSVNVYQSLKNKTDYRTGLNANDEKVYDKLYNDALKDAEAEKGESLSSREKNKLKESILERFEKGDIGIDTIEEVLGGDSYTAFIESNKKDAKNKKEFETIKDEYDTLYKMKNMEKSDEQIDRQKALKEKLDGFKFDSNTDALKMQMSQEVEALARKGKLAEAYNERARRSEAFSVDLSRYKGKQREAVERAVKSGVLNNTFRSHELVDILSKIEADKGIVFDYVNNAKLKESGFAVEGKIVNGFVKNGAITLNINSPKAWQSTVGHEITHILEGTDAYGVLQKSLFAYAKSKGELDSRRANLTEVYNGIDADIDSELTADLVGDYLFNDKNFIKNLTTDRNLFQKVYDEIKYLCKVATGKELTEIEKVRREFDKAWNELGKKGVATNEGVNYSVSAEQQAQIDNRANTAVETFGLTNDFKQAGFVLPNGKMLNLSKYGSGIQHNQVETLYDGDTKGDLAVAQFMSDGNVRLNEKAPGIEINSNIAPTVSQYNVIARLISQSRGKGRFYVDITDSNGKYVDSLEYSDDFSAEQVIYDIKEYFENGKVKYSISGKNSKTSDISLLSQAEESLSKGVDSETIRQETGWYKGYDGKWRYEIDDSKMDFNINGHFTNPDVIRHRELEYKFLTDTENMTDAEIKELQSLSKALEGVRKSPTTLGDYLKHDELFEAYPELRDIKLTFDKIDTGALGKYRFGKNEIVLDNSIRDDNERIKSTLIHEIQHAIQEIEGFANGSSVEYWKAKRQDIVDTISGARQNLNLWLDDIGYNDFVKSSMQEVVNKEKTIEQHFEDCKEFKANSKYAEQIANCEAELAEFQQQYDEITNGMTAYEQYENTAGEIEARDTENRLNLNAEERRNTRPDIDRDNVVFADNVKYSVSEDSEGNNLTAEQQNKFAKSKVRDAKGRLLPLYHGSRSEAFSVFDMEKGVWLATDPRYSEVYAGQWHSWRDDDPEFASRRTDLNGLEPEVYTDPDYRVYKVYADIQNPLDIGEIDDYLSDGKVGALARALGVRYSELKAIADNYMEEPTYMLTRSTEFLDLAESKGFDGLKATEKGRETWCVIQSADQVKLTTNKTPTADPDIRFSLSNNTLDNEQDLVYNDKRGEEYVTTDEFRSLQAKCKGMSDEDIQLYHSGNKQIDDGLRERFSRGIKSIFLESKNNGISYDKGILNLTAKNNNFNMHEGVNGSLFHDVFEMARNHLKYGELVDLHEIETTEDGIGYNDCYNYLSDDGLSGFSITPDGDLISVFNSSGKSGFLRAIAPIIKEKAKTLDCYASENQNLMGMYSAIFGFKAASVMDYNMKFDHDNIAENHNKPKIAFMVNTESEIETKSFNKDQYDEAVAYRNGFIMPENVAPVKNSLSNEGEEFALTGDYSTPMNELALAPTQEDIANNATPTEETSSIDLAPLPEDAPMPTNAKPKSAQIADGTRGDVLLNESLDNYPMQTIEQKIAENIRAIEGELADNRDLRREAEANYNEQIANLQKQYNAKKNKNTKTAYNILQSISRIERLKASADARFAKRISDLEARLEKMNTDEYHRAMYKKDKMQGYADWAANILGDTTTWRDKKTGLQYATNTEHRNLRDIVRDANGNRDTARADEIYDATMGEYNRNQARKNRAVTAIKQKFAEMKITKAESTYIQMLGELKYNPDTTLTSEEVNEYYEKHKKKIDAAKVDNAIELARQTYDNALNELNAKLREQGMREIPHRQGYFPHFTEPKQNFIQKLFNWKTQDTEIPTSIAGLTEDFKPNKSWQSFDKTRYSDETDYNFLKGLDSYLEGAYDWIYHLEDIQKRRAVENHIRFTHSDEGIKAKIKEVYADETLDADEAQAKIEQILGEAKNPLNNFVQDFMTHTNILTNKKNSYDRTTEQAFNRKIYSTMTNVQNRMSANMVLANVRSALTNFIPITQSWAQVSPLRSLEATKDTIANAFKDDGLIEKSTFLTNRLRETDNLYMSNWDKVLDKSGIMFEVVDNFASQVIWRSKYKDNLAKGMTEAQAIANADQFAENVMAGRSKGNEPTLFNAKSPFVKMFTLFQLEVNNQYGYFLKDVPTDLKTETNHWKLNMAKGYTTAFLGAYAYNALLEQLAGSGAALDPIGIIEDLLKDLGLFDDDEEEKEPSEIVGNLAENVVEELPFVGGLFGGGRIPINSILPYKDEGLIGGLEQFTEDVSEGNWGNIGKEMMNPLLNIAMPVGGGQLKKTVQGLGMFNTDEEHPIAGSYTDSGDLRFPVEDTTANRTQAAIFGQWANENARDYIENGRKPLNEKQTQEFIDVEMPIADYWKYRDGLKGLKKNEEKADYINSLDIEDWQKNLLINNILDRKEDVDMSNYDDFADWEEFDYAQKNPEKYAFSKSVGGYKAYKIYSEDLYDIKADKDINGKSISGSRKQKVLEYINNLDADYETKLILFKSEYPSDKTYDAEIINYINNLGDLTYEERVSVFEELGFKVIDGQIYY